MIQRITIISLLLITLVLIGSHDAQAQKRIQFAKGKSSATIQGRTGSFGVTYVVRAKSGQKLILNLSPAKQVGIRVETRGTFGEMVLLRENRGGTYEIDLEESGDYTIFVGSTSRPPAAFTLTVKIARLADI